VIAQLQPFRSNNAELLPFTQQKRQSSSSIASSQANSENFGDQTSENGGSDVERDDSEDTDEDEVCAPRLADSASALPVELTDEDTVVEEISRQELRAAASASAHAIRAHAAEHRAKFDFGAAFRRTPAIEIKLENQDMSLKNMIFPKRVRATSNAAPGIGSSERPAPMHVNSRGDGAPAGVQCVDDNRKVAADASAEKAAGSSWLRATGYRHSFDAKAAFTEKPSRLDLSSFQQKSVSLKALLFGYSPLQAGRDT
jgi:hypothetical protein